VNHKKIGISLRVIQNKNYEEKRDAISHDWSQFCEELNFIPILIPNTLSNIELFLEKLELDGIILSGGGDIGLDIERDETEKKLLKYGIKNNLPILGVCRGMQIINKFFNGEVIKTQNNEHVNLDHSINIIEESFSNIIGKEIFVNSYHNNIIFQNNLGKNLKPFAITKKDNSIEGFFHNQYSVIGVMWHPERKQNNNNKLLLQKIFTDDNDK
jgi:putative glutamine amidotransferase|tara:strand:+ start:1200 stop:1838 length:639 start_codon:yes stop_codon:yes gene_type:complete